MEPQMELQCPYCGSGEVVQRSWADKTKFSDEARRRGEIALKPPWKGSWFAVYFPLVYIAIFLFLMLFADVDHRGPHNVWGEIWMGMLGCVLVLLYYAPISICVWILIIAVFSPWSGRLRAAREKWAASYICYRCGEVFEEPQNNSG
jgi:DNA-directed RNA polymerase subunit RPC12/RpoP